MEGMRNAQYYDLYTYRLVTDVIFAGAQDQGFQRSFSSVDDQYYFDQLISGLWPSGCLRRWRSPVDRLSRVSP